jgi:antitoxin (DNA-binding transcriptional repressor) of toxin-antitoxin stability system
MKINPQRIMNASDARAAISSVLDNALAGYVTHISREGKIEAHVVPANALVHEGNELDAMMVGALESAARWLADDAIKSGFHQAGDSIGRVFAWLWDCDPDKAVTWLAAYGISVIEEFQSRGFMRPSFGVLWEVLANALGVGLSRGDIRDFELRARERLPLHISPFTLDELAGRPRPRGTDDLWPDTTDSQHGWVKKRWRDVVVGDFVPNPDFGYELSLGDEHWCRITRIDETAITLSRHDGNALDYASSPDQWVPFQCYGPWRWGLR